MGDYRPKIEQRLGYNLPRIAAALLLALLQTALAPAVWHIRIDWVLVVVVCITLVQGFAVGLRWALYGGLALGVLSPLPIGAHLLALSLAATVTAVATDGFPRDNRPVPTLAIMMVSLLYGGVIAALTTATGHPVMWARYPVTIILPGALANAAAALPIYTLVEHFHRHGRAGAVLDQ